MVFGVVGREVDAQHSALTLPENGRNVRNGRLCSLLGHQLRPPTFSVISIRPSGRKAIRQGRLKRRDLGHGEGQVRVRLLLACVNLRRCAARSHGQEQPRDR